MMRAVCVVMMLVLVAVVRADSDDAILKKYGKMKIFESCFGAENAKAYMRKLKDAALKCKTMPVEFKRQFSSTSTRFSSSALASPAFGSNFANSPMAIKGIDWSSLFANIGQQSGGTKYIPIPVYVPERSYRQRRSSDDFQFFNADRVRDISRKMQAKVSNVTCVMKTLGYMDDSNELLYNNYLAEIRSVPGIDNELLRDLVQAVEDCKAMATCVPTNNIQMPTTPAMIRYKTFTKCNMHFKYMACLKKDLRSSRDEFDLSGLGYAMEGADDDEKMLAIMWGKTNLMGGDSYNF